MRTLRLQFHLLNPFNKNLKETEMANGSYIMGFMLFCLKLQFVYVLFGKEVSG